jgi:predicted dienelactone hydrolase
MPDIRTRRWSPGTLLFLALIAPGALAAAPPDYSRPGTRQVEVVVTEVSDADRNRRIPLKLYAPTGGDKVPVILFSHGLGGSREGGRAWGEHWASHGYLSIHVQHAGSDEGALRDAMKGQGREGLKAAMSPRAFADRVHDIRFLIDLVQREPTRIHRDAVRADARRIGMSGHSYGARTTLALAGERVPFASGEFVEPRIAAAIAFSPMAPPPPGSWPKRFGDIRLPLLSVTGTQDRDVLLGESPEVRREPYRHMPPGDKYLLVLQSADHMLFNGQEGFRGGLSRRDVAMYDHVKAFTLAFWEAHLKGDAAAKQWLSGGAARAVLDQAGEFERK